MAACGNNGLLGTTVATQSGIRFINGSPNAAGPTSGIDVYLSGNSSAVNGTTPLAYGKATTLSYVNSQTYTVTVDQGGTKNQVVACSTPSLGANTRYTVVIAGEVGGAGNSAVQCQIFAETIYSLPAGSFQLAFHNASPALGAAYPSGVGYGTFGNSSPPAYGLFAGPLAAFTAPTSSEANGVAQNVLPAGVETAPGMGVYVADPAVNPPTSGTVKATLLPSQLQPGYVTAVYPAPTPASSVQPCLDSNNLYPYYESPSPTPTPTSTTAPTPAPTPTAAPGTCSALSTVMSVYAIDAPAGSGNVANLVGVSD